MSTERHVQEYSQQLHHSSLYWIQYKDPPIGKRIHNNGYSQQRNATQQYQKKKKKPKQATDTHECKMNFKNHRRVHR